jgi:predicted membrane-bound spermidine synthase
VPIRRSAGTDNAYLEINLYCNQLQLATDDALYSDGDRYVPAVAAIKNLKKFLPVMRTVLVLGAGLCSMVYVMRRRRCEADFTLVEKDKTVLEWAMETLPPKAETMRPVCADAELFMQQNEVQYDFVFIDIFKGRVVPDFVLTHEFLQRCRNSLSEGGHLAFNYMVNNEQDWVRVRNTFTDIFPEHDIVKHGMNRILIGNLSAENVERKSGHEGQSGSGERRAEMRV